MENCILRACLVFSSCAHIFLLMHLHNSLSLLPGAYLPKSCVLGKTEGKRRRKQQSMRCLDSITDLMDRNLNKLWEIVEDRAGWFATVHRIRKSQTQLKNDSEAETPVLWLPHAKN